jgi:outer membrane protein TolC
MITLRAIAARSRAARHHAVWAVCVCAFGLVAPRLSRAADDASPPAAASRADLRRCLDLADRNHPAILEARAKLRQVQAQLDEAHFAPFMQFKASGGVSLAPTVRGSNVFSPNTDASLTANLGVAYKVGISGVIPLWTFGKISHLWQAAEANVEINRGGIDVSRDGVRYDVRRAYFGLQLARDSLDLVAGARKQIATAESKLAKRVEQDEADPIDLLKMRTFAAELDAKHAEAERHARVARAGLRFYTGAPGLDIVDVPLRAAQHKLGGMARYLAAARVYRPEMRMVRAGIAASQAQIKLRRAQLFPDLGLGLGIGMTAAPEVANQINPYVSDGGNYIHYGVALVFQWNLDLLPAWSRIEQAKAQLDQVMALDRKALGGIATEVEKAYAEAIDWQKRLDAYKKAQGYAKQWLATVKQSIDVGTMEDKDLIEPAKAYAQNRYKLYEATMELNLAISRLAKASGWDAIAPDGR